MIKIKLTFNEVNKIIQTRYNLPCTDTRQTTSSIYNEKIFYTQEDVINYLTLLEKEGQNNV